MATRSHETSTAWSSTTPPCFDSIARAVAVTGLLTALAIRVCICPESATG